MNDLSDKDVQQHLDHTHIPFLSCNNPNVSHSVSQELY